MDITTAYRITDTFLLALCLWREARGESEACIRGVACSIMNRVKRPSWWGDTVQSVITKKWQYSSMTDPNDVQLTLFPNRTDMRWLACLQMADLALQDALINPVPGADSYHDISIPPPRWATQEAFVAQIGRIRFYNLDHDVEAIKETQHA